MTRICPKCKTILFRDGKNTYHCIGCSLNGSYIDMERQAIQIRDRVERHAIKVECVRCGVRKVLNKEISCSTLINNNSRFICHDCQSIIRIGRR
jgi:hypothetical protein